MIANSFLKRGLPRARPELNEFPVAGVASTHGDNFVRVRSTDGTACFHRRPRFSAGDVCVCPCSVDRSPCSFLWRELCQCGSCLWSRKARLVKYTRKPTCCRKVLERGAPPRRGLILSRGWSFGFFHIMMGNQQAASRHIRSSSCPC